MWKSCSKCGKIHKDTEKCTIKRQPVEKTLDQKLRSHRKWTDKSGEIREKSKWLCAVCLQEGIYNYDRLEVHHIEKLKDNSERLLDNYNLVCLCKRHHELADEGKIEASYLEELARCREEGKYPPPPLQKLKNVSETTRLPSNTKKA